MGLLRRRSGPPDPDPSDPSPTDPSPAGASGPPPADALAPQAAAGELAALSTELEEESATARKRGVRRTADLVASTARALGRGGTSAAKGAGYGSRALADRLLVQAPRIPIRDLATIRAQHPGADGPEALADLLVTGALRASGAVGASIGAAAMLPVPPAMPVEIAAETLVVAAVEIKLIAELHQVYGVPATGTASQRTVAYVTAWADRRGIDSSALSHPSGAVALAGLAVGAEVRQKVRKRLTRSTLRKLPSMIPMLVGAGIGAMLNRRDTGRLATRVRADLRARTASDPGYWAAADPGRGTVSGPG
ncbi:hypothetical protein AB0D08_25275 [Kitasatospora sp. NPDC048540]|uniref:hypothetical protein n=1 Tax=unclassified Kitasatospora TaxID=2633591 RepID=UPI0007C68A6A|nr:hypothetical protein [Kitasatospora sp. MBT63]